MSAAATLSTSVDTQCELGQDLSLGASCCCFLFRCICSRRQTFDPQPKNGVLLLLRLLIGCNGIFKGVTL
ncbi:hypothetical protein BS78_05G184800 [Paspalum vaginatum]|nr:hypothetical protein BS78_05G184800 [Paspalum vaginatum]